MVYPALMLAASLAVAGVLLVWVIPNVTSLMGDLNQELPLATKVVLGVSDFLTSTWIPLGIAFCLAFLVLNRAVQTTRGRWVWHGLKLRLPVVGRLIRFVSISRFARTLSTLVSGGLNIVSALDISKRVAGNVVIGAAIDTAKDAITKGASIAGTLRQSGQFPPLVTHMISVGEASGELDEMLLRIADTYDKLVDNALQRMLALLGPILLMFVAGMILLIILSTLLPLLSLTSAL
jgi:type II secretory pathway component PulF